MCFWLWNWKLYGNNNNCVWYLNYKQCNYLYYLSYRLFCLYILRFMSILWYWLLLKRRKLYFLFELRWWLMHRMWNGWCWYALFSMLCWVLLLSILIHLLFRLFWRYSYLLKRYSLLKLWYFLQYLPNQLF